VNYVIIIIIIIAKVIKPDLYTISPCNYRMTQIFDRGNFDEWHRASGKKLTKKILTNSIMLTPTFINGYLAIVHVAEDIDGKTGTYNNNALR